MLSQSDIRHLAQKEITEEMALGQLHRFETGFPFLRLKGAATPGNGITVISSSWAEQAKARWFAYLTSGGDVTKFVPASGAASRMFKALFAFADSDSDEIKPGSEIAQLFAELPKLPFISELGETCQKLYGTSLDSLITAGRNRDVIRAIISADGMNYGNLPKGLLTFHRYADGTTRTPLEEQLVEGAQTAAVNSVAKLHFTVSTPHRRLFTEKIEKVLPKIKDITGVDFQISLSEQKPSTDTLAANADNTPFRDQDGNIVTRPGGHGALIRNLNDLDATVVFIKNIDNVVPDSLRQSTIEYKKILAGVLIQIIDRLHLYLSELEKGVPSEPELEKMMDFALTTLCIVPGKEFSSADEKAQWLKAKFDRPTRVCGMVRNEGEPGGGPYIAVNPDGSASPQILESTQIDMANKEYVAMMEKATHFNPVDLVCYIKDAAGRKYDLPAYVDPASGFISSKSQQGRELKALELPGLWNGAMSDWNTMFVEVPAATFNPVKTVNDLLRKAHQEG